MTPGREAVLAHKGRLLYERACGGAGACVEGFVEHHLGRGEDEAVRALMSFLGEEAERLRQAGPSERLSMTLGLVERIGARLNRGGAS